MAVQPRDPALADVVGALVAERRALPTSPSPADIRCRAGISGRSLAAVLGVHPTTLMHWEAGDWTPSPEHAAAWAAALDAMAQAARS
jgi:DNA-binding XRE family transcriptional regulator